MAGVPFDVVEELATPETSATARKFLVSESELTNAKSRVDELLQSRKHDLSKEQFRAWRRTTRFNSMPPPAEPRAGIFADCYASGIQLIKIEAELADCLHHELEQARSRLIMAAQAILPRYLVFASAGVRESIERNAPDSQPLWPRTKKLRARERHLLLYLQRVAAKNDTLSEYGPGGWGKTFSHRPTVGVIHLDPEPGILSREVFLERWTAHAAAAALNADPDSPSEVQVPALEPYAFNVLCDDVGKWPAATPRDRWLSILMPIADLPKKFAQAGSVSGRVHVMDEANARLGHLGASRESTRFLYAATNPIGEECLRECNFEISEKLLNEVAVEAAPWIDLWRDNYAFVAYRIALALRGVLERMKQRAPTLPSFLAACEEARLPLTGAGMVALAQTAFSEVKALFRQRMELNAHRSVYELTIQDCQFVRQDLEYPKFDEYTYPSADIQLAAKSIEAISNGEYQWVLAELHPAVALLHHGFYWSCPDKASLSKDLARTTLGKPNFHYGFFAADFTATTTVRFFDALPDLTWFVAPQRGNQKWQTVAPSKAEVYVDAGGDVCLRRADDHYHLGSFARNWIIPLGFHPFFFSCGKHTPRLRCGKVIVQRRSWTISAQELMPGDYTGVSRDLVLAVEKLRAEKDLPRFVYIRPTEQALRRSGAEGRDKDTKPVFIDLESYLFHEILYRWLRKAGEIEVTEMLPAPDDLFWKEADGRRTFELRTLIVPPS